MSSPKTVATSAAMVAGGMYLLYKSTSTILTTVSKMQMNPFDDELGSVIREKGAPSYDEIKALGIIAGKSVLLVGGTRGVGYGTALAMAMSGASTVTIVGRSEASGSNAVSTIVGELDNESESTVNFVRGDIGTVTSANELIEKLQKCDTRYDYLIVTAAIFPHRKDPSPLNADGIEKSFGIGVVGRFLLFRKAHSFMKPPTEDPSHSPMILNVLASGGKMGKRFDRRLVRSLHGFHMFNIANFALGNEITLHKLTTSGGENSDGKPYAIPIVTTHPGILKTDLHRGQGLWMDIAEAIAVHFMGISKEECGRREVSILCTVGEKRRKKKISSLLTIVDNFGYGRLINNDMEKDVQDHGDWLWDLLVLMEGGGSIDEYKD